MVKHQQMGGFARGQKSRRSRSGCLLVIFAAVCVAVGVPILNLFHSEPLRISEETTYRTGPLTSDGQRIDYFAVIEKENSPDQIATEENGFRLFVQHVALPVAVEPWHFEQTCLKLGLDASDVKPELTYVEPYAFLKTYVESGDFDQAVVERLRADKQSNDLPSDKGTHRDVYVESKTTEDEATSQGDGSEEDDREDPSQDNFDESANEPDPDFVLSERLSTPWTLDDMPMMQAWLKSSGPALDLLGEAVRKPIFLIPLVRQDENDPLLALLLPNLQTMRSFARGLLARANYRLGTGDVDGAIDDIMTCERLGRHLGHGETIIHLLVGIAIEGIADSVGIAGDPQHPATKEQLQRLMRELDELPAMAGLDAKMRFERYAGLDVLQRLAHGDESLDEFFSAPSHAARALSLFGFDWNIAAARLNEHYDLLISEGIEPEFSFRTMALISRRARSEVLADVLASQLLPALSSAAEAVHRHQCFEQMKRITLAMLVYECDHAALPPACTVDPQGNPLHSWRVLLLPYLGQDELYGKIRLDEPWNSEHNLALHDKDVDVYRCRSVSTAKPGDTTYSVVVGPEMPFDAGVGKKLADLGVGNTQMILLVERASAVCWMDPTKEVTQAEADLGINIQAPQGATPPTANGIASPHPGGANFGLRDGAARFLSDTFATEEFQELLRGTDTMDY